MFQTELLMEKSLRATGLNIRDIVIFSLCNINRSIYRLGSGVCQHSGGTLLVSCKQYLCTMNFIFLKELLNFFLY